MMSASLLDSVHRILREDQVAVLITVLFVLIQFGIFVWVRAKTGKTLAAGRDRLSGIAIALEEARNRRAKGKEGSDRDEVDITESRSQESKIVSSDSKASRAWNLSVLAQTEPTRAADALEPEVAFAPARLLPRDYNTRLDAGAPGLFTALGIMGTFVGLILGFLQVDPADATQSVGPLIGGMVVAFVNSLLGVFLSILWSYRSKIRRHEFDAAAEALLFEAEYRFHSSGVGEQLRNGFSAITTHLKGLRDSSDASSRALLEDLRTGLKDLKKSTETSSQNLLDGLSPKLADSFKTLVATPFEQLTGSVEAFDGVVRDAMIRQEAIAVRLERTSEVLDGAKSALAESLITATACVGQFETATGQLHAGTEEVRAVVSETRLASEALHTVVGDVQQNAERYSEAAGSMALASTSMSAAGAAMSEHAAAFQGATQDLARTVAGVQSLTEEGVTESLVRVQESLREAVESLFGGMKETGATIAQAQVEGSRAIVEMLDERVDQLGARVTGALEQAAAEVKMASERTVEAHASGTDEVVDGMRSSVSLLTQRLAEDLAGITSGLPEEVRALNESMIQGRKEMLDAFEQGAGRVVASLDKVSTDLSDRIAKDFRSLAEHFPEQLRSVTDALEQTHQKTVQAYQESSTRVVDAVDERMSDLTDRLSAELATLSNRLPAEVASLNQAMAQIRAHIQRATRSMDDAVQQLAVRTPQALQAQLTEFDSALAQAMNHFSGTLMQWDGKIEDIQQLSDDLRRLANVAAKRFPAPRIAEVTAP